MKCKKQNKKNIGQFYHPVNAIKTNTRPSVIDPLNLFTKLCWYQAFAKSLQRQDTSVCFLLRIFTMDLTPCNVTGVKSILNLQQNPHVSYLQRRNQPRMDRPL